MKVLSRLAGAVCMTGVTLTHLPVALAQSPVLPTTSPTPVEVARTSVGLPSVPTVKVMAIGTFPKPPSPAALKAILPQEMSDTARLYLAGKIDQWYVRQDKSGVVFLLNVTSVDEAKQLLDTLPLAKANMMRFDLIPLGPLQPMATLLMPPGAK